MYHIGGNTQPSEIFPTRIKAYFYCRVQVGIDDIAADHKQVFYKSLQDQETRGKKHHNIFESIGASYTTPQGKSSII